MQNAFRDTVINQQSFIAFLEEIKHLKLQRNRSQVHVDLYLVVYESNWLEKQS